jgi:hypothetical protein
MSRCAWPLSLLPSLLSASLALAADIGVEPTGYGNGSNLVILGSIEVGDAERFRKIVIGEIDQGKWIGSVSVFSPGGSAYDSMSIGKQVRTLRASTKAPSRLRERAGGPQELNLCQTYFRASGGSFRYNIRTRSGDARCTCTSGCFLIWAAGVGRSGDVLGVHRMRWQDFHFESVAQAESMYGAAIGEMSEYLRSMDVPDNVIRLTMNTPSSSMYFLNKTELAPMSGDSATLEEIVAQRCRGLSKNPTAVGGGYSYSSYAQCAQNLSEEASRTGAREFMAKFASPPRH